MTAATIEPVMNPRRTATPGAFQHGLSKLRAWSLAYGAWLASLVALIAFWHFSVKTWDISPALLPSPGAVGHALWQNLADGTFIVDLRTTLAEVLLGFLIGGSVGFALAILISEFKAARLIIYPYIIGFQSMPKTALAPMFLIWFGFGMESKVAQVVISAFFPVLINSLAGLTRVDPDQLDMMKAFCGKRWRVFYMVKLPSALPSIFAGLELAIVFSMLMAVVAEYLGSTAGLGYRILKLNTSMDVAAMFAALLLLSFVGFALHGVVKHVARKIVFWGNARDSQLKF